VEVEPGLELVGAVEEVVFRLPLVFSVVVLGLELELAVPYGELVDGEVEVVADVLPDVLVSLEVLVPLEGEVLVLLEGEL